MEKELSEELYSSLGELLNLKGSLLLLNSLRGEYGVLRYLLSVKDNVSAAELHRSLGVVPGRMADILKSLEKKGWVIKKRDDNDKRIVKVSITDEGRNAAFEKREAIRRESEGLYDMLGMEGTAELIRLLKIVLSYYENH